VEDEMKNTTKFAEHYLAATERFMDALAEPTQYNFERAQTKAILAIGASFSDGAEWDVAQDLARSITAAARRNGVVL